MIRIVIVEDEVRTRQGLERLIKKINPDYQVVSSAENGYDGLQAISQSKPDIVITDIKMPKMDGLKMIEQAKKMGAECKFVILSGYSDFEYARTGILLDVKDYLLKPINITMLKEMLEKVSDMVRKEHATMEDNVKLSTEEQYSPAVQGMINALNKSLCLPYDLEYFAREYHMTPEYLSNLFAKETKCSFSNYKKNLRMEKAKELLLTTDMKVSEIACLVGYPDQKYFSKVFKEYTGESAKQYILTHFFEDKVIKERK